MALQFSENRQRNIGLAVSSNPRTVLSSVGLQEATQAEALAGSIQNRYISPLRLQQKFDDVDPLVSADFATQAEADGAQSARRQ